MRRSLAPVLGFLLILCVLASVLPAAGADTDLRVLRTIRFGDSPDTVQSKVRGDTQITSGWEWIGTVVGLSREELRERLERTFGGPVDPVLDAFQVRQPYWYSLDGHTFLLRFSYCSTRLCAVTLEQFPPTVTASDTAVLRRTHELLVGMIERRYGAPNGVRSDTGATVRGDEPSWTHTWRVGVGEATKRIRIGIDRHFGWSRAVMRIDHPGYLGAASRRDDRRREELIERRHRDF